MRLGWLIILSRGHVSQICSGLAYIHKEGYIHMDVKVSPPSWEWIDSSSLDSVLPSSSDLTNYRAVCLSVQQLENVFISRADHTNLRNNEWVVRTKLGAGRAGYRRVYRSPLVGPYW